MGVLYQKDLKKYQNWFDEAAKMLGVDVQYRYIIERRTETATGESVYSELSKPIPQSVIIEEGLPKVESLKQLGWFVDTKDDTLLVDFSNKTPNLQEGCRFTLQSNKNKEQIKEYVIIKLSSEQLYPTCIKCLCSPILDNESIIDNQGNIEYPEQSILSDEENNTFINAEPKITIF